jgi:hypothetical protein
MAGTLQGAPQLGDAHHGRLRPIERCRPGPIRRD